MEGLVAVDYSELEQHQHGAVRIIRERVTQAQHRFEAVIPTLDAQDDSKNKRGLLYREPVPLGPRTSPARAPSTKTGPSARARKASADSNSDAPSFRAALDAQRFHPSERPSSSRGVGVGVGVGRAEHESYLARHERAVEGPKHELRVRPFGSAPNTRSVSGGGETSSSSKTKPTLHRTRSAYTIKPKTGSTKGKRRPSTANDDSTAPISREADLGAGEEREEMGSMKDRLSIQTFIPSAFRTQSPPSTPTTSTIPISPVSRRESINKTSAPNASSSSGSGSVLRRGFSRARAQTHTGASITSVLASSSFASNENNARRGETFPYPVLDLQGPAQGRESPPAYLLDDDPFAASTPLTSPSGSMATLSMPPTPSIYEPHQSTLPPIPQIPTTPPSPLNPHSTKDKDGEEGVVAEVASDVDRKGKSRSTPTSPSAKTSAMPSLYAMSPMASSSKAGPSSSSTVRPPPPLHTHSTPPPLSPPQTPHSSSFSPPQSPPHPPPSRTRPAHTRPAFAPRPSLPSLHALARMDIPVSALAGMVGLHYGRSGKKRKGKVGAGLPLEPWAQDEEDEDDEEDVPEIKTEQEADTEVSEQEGGEGSADTEEVQIVVPESQDKSLPVTPISSISDTSASPDMPLYSLSVQETEQVTCEKDLPDVPFTPERGSFFSLTGGNADAATQAKVAAAQAQATASTSGQNTEGTPETLSASASDHLCVSPSLQLSTSATAAKAEHDDELGITDGGGRPDEEGAVSGATSDLSATATIGDVNRDRLPRNEASAFDECRSLPPLNFQRSSQSSFSAALDLIVDYDETPSEPTAHPAKPAGGVIDSDWYQSRGLSDAGRSVDDHRDTEHTLESLESGKHIEHELASAGDHTSVIRLVTEDVNYAPSTALSVVPTSDEIGGAVSVRKQDKTSDGPTPMLNYETPADGNRLDGRQADSDHFDFDDNDGEFGRHGETQTRRRSNQIQLRSVPLATSSSALTSATLLPGLPATATGSVRAITSPPSPPASTLNHTPVASAPSTSLLAPPLVPHHHLAPPTLAIAIPLRSDSGRLTPGSADASPPASPLGSVEDYGIVLPRSISPNYYAPLQQANARPDSLTLDPELPARSRSNTVSEGAPSEQRALELTTIEAQGTTETQTQTILASTTTAEEEEDDSMLPPLSTLPEEDPVFTFSPTRTYSTDISRKSSWSSSLSRSRSGQSGRSGRSNSSSNSGYGSVTAQYAYPPSLPSLHSQSDLEVRRGRQGSDSSVSTFDELSSSAGSYVAQAYVTPPGESVVAQKYDDAELAAAEGSFAPRSSHATAFYDEYDRDSGIRIPNGVDENGWRPFNSATAGFEPGSSGSTLRASINSVMRRRGNRNGSSEEEWMDSEVMGGRSGGPVAVSAPVNVRTRTHAGGYSGSRGGSYAWKESNATGDGYGYKGDFHARRGRGDSSGSEFGGRRDPGDGRRNNGNGRDDGRGGDDRRGRKPTVSVPSTSDSDSSESEDDYGQDRPPVPQLAPAVEAFNQRRNGRKGVFKRPEDLQPGVPSTQDSTEDDDVPLAQRIPTALQAQKSIRRQVRDEREQRRRDRARSRPRGEEQSSAGPSTASTSALMDFPVRGRTNSFRHPQSAAPAFNGSALSSSQEAALMAQRATEAPPVRRARAKTIGDSSGFKPDDLMKRLLRVQAQTDAEVPRVPPTPSPVPRTSTEVSASDRSFQSPLDYVSAPASAAVQRTQQYPPAPPLGPRQNSGSGAKDSGRTLRPMRSFHHPSTPGGVSPISAVPIVRRPTSAKGRQSQEGHSEEHTRNKLIKSARSSLEGNRPMFKSNRASVDDSAQPPVPPLPASARLPSSAYPTPTSPVRTNFPPMVSNPNAVQMRIFIGDLQRFNMVEVGPETNAKDVLDMLQQQGDLREESRRSTGWMLFEVCQDYGMERPVRDFELITDISGSWNKEKTANIFMAKRSSLSFTLANIPSSIPKRTGYVDYESKKGKWNKRWLELREHGLWLSKREGKDDEFLCSLSAFDAYVVTRIHKAPRSFVFAVKSTDPISLFENKADYVHVFSCSEDVGRHWLESILLARSYILYQERNVLFRSKSTSQAANGSSGAALSRAGTRKRAPVQPLVNVAPPFSAPSSALPSAGPFEPGSLLAKRTAAEGA